MSWKEKFEEFDVGEEGAEEFAKDMALSSEGAPKRS
jgi:hypothetical protein